MKLQAYLVSLTTAIVLLGPAETRAREPRPQPGGGYGMHELWRLELSDGQREQLETLAASHRGEMEAHAPRAESLHAALETLWSAAELDGEAILARTAELSELHKQMDQTRARHRIAVLSLLTAEQRSELARRIEERRESFDRRDGPPMMRGPRPERGPRGARRPF